MNVGLLLRILRSRYRLILVILTVTVVSVLIASFTMSKVYTSEVVLFVDVKSMDPVLGGAVHSPQTVRGVLATQAEIVKSDRVVHAVVREIGLDRSEGLIEAWRRDTGGEGDLVAWIGQLVRQRLSVTPSNEGSTIAISYDGSSPESSAQIANAFAKVFLETVLSLRSAPAKESAQYFEDQLREYRERLQQAHSRMSAFQQASGIVATDERLDIENQRLQELSSQLVVIQSLATESRSRRDAVRRGRDTMPEVVQNQLVQALKGELGRAEARLEELSARLGPNHPEYQSALAEVRVLRSRLGSEIERVSSSIVTDSAVNMQREAEIRNALETQRARVLKLKKDYDTLSALSREVDNAQKALELVSQRLTQTNLESQAPQSNVGILSPALIPTDPSRPKPLLNTIVGAFVGMLLGLLAALSIETLRRPVRTAEDLFEALELPVLAVLPPAATRRAQRLIGNTGPTITPPNLRLGN